MSLLRIELDRRGAGGGPREIVICPADERTSLSEDRLPPHFPLYPLFPRFCPRTRTDKAVRTNGVPYISGFSGWTSPRSTIRVITAT